MADEAAGAAGRVGNGRCRLSPLVAHVDHEWMNEWLNAYSLPGFQGQMKSVS